jgi:ABC-type lipoprotein release transport system permease subunit
MPDEAHEITVRAKESGQTAAITERLKQMPILEGTEVQPWQEIVPELVLILKYSDYTGYFVLIIIFVAAIAGIANTLMMSTFERFREFGMLLALGSRPLRIIRMIIYEAVLIGLLGVVIGTIFGLAFVVGTSGTGINMASWGGDGQVEDMGYMGLNLPLHVFPKIQSSDIFLGLAAVMVTSLLASIWPAWIAGRLEPMEAMRA